MDDTASDKLWPAYKVCTRCYARYSAGDAACPQCRNPEFALPGTDANRLATLRAEGAFKGHIVSYRRKREDANANRNDS